MSSLEFIIELSNMDFVSHLFKGIFISFITYYIFIKISKSENKKMKNIILTSTAIIIVNIFSSTLKFLLDTYYCIIFQSISMIIWNYFNFKKEILYTILITIIAFGISYVLLFISIAISFIPIVVFDITNNYINLIILVLVYILIMYFVLKIRKIKNGLIFLQERLKDEYLDILLLNISVIILFMVMIVSGDSLVEHIVFTVFFLAIIMFLTIKKSLELYYKQTQLIKEFDETKEELEEKKAEIKRLEKENLDYGKTSHTLAHKQRLLEYKINQLIENSTEKEIINIKTELDKLSEQIYVKPTMTEISKAGIAEIDDMLKYMQAECEKNKIDFELQISGNIYYMINNLISKEELQILIADHIKDAIIAINYSNNENRSILIRLGNIDNEYSLYIYDSGIEFEEKTLENLGKKPVTTHADDGGTGMGFMNTFDTLRKHKASLIIKEIGKPSKDNYTKVIMIKFDGKNEFKIISYRKQKKSIKYS